MTSHPISHAARVIDANANRAREAIRVMEDAARFLLDDAALAKSLKQLRHDLAAALRKLPPHLVIEWHRDTPGDVGTQLTTPAESHRADARDVVVAAGKRLTEALRSIEEFGKTIDAGFAANVEQLRYRAYDIESKLHRAMAQLAAPQWRLCVLVTEGLCEHHDWLEVARAAIDGGADCIQLREKQLEAGELLDRAKRLVELAGDQAAVVVNDRPDVALLAGAAGAHLGQGDLPIDQLRRWTGTALWLGASTHNLREAKQAVRAGADYCGVGAIFSSTTKQRKTSGLAYLAKFIERFPDTPQLAIGGITADNVDEVVDAGAKGIAVSGCVCGAKRPATIARKLRRAVNRATR